MREAQEERRSLLRRHRLLLPLLQLHRRRHPAALRRGAASAANPDGQITHPIQPTGDHRGRNDLDGQQRRVPGEERGLAVVVVVIMRLHRHCWSRANQTNQRGNGRVEARAR